MIPCTFGMVLQWIRDYPGHGYLSLNLEFDRAIHLVGYYGDEPKLHERPLELSVSVIFHWHENNPVGILHTAVDTQLTSLEDTSYVDPTDEDQTKLSQLYILLAHYCDCANQEKKTQVALDQRYHL